MKKLRVIADRNLHFAGLFILAGIWQLVVSAQIVDPVLLPGPVETFKALWSGFSGGGVRFSGKGGRILFKLK